MYFTYHFSLANKCLFPFYALILILLISRCVSVAQDKLTIEARPLGQLPAVLKESSGLAITGTNRIWTHNDAGNTNKIFCVDTTGTLLRSLFVYNALNIDWEDLAMDPQRNIYINDAGNNANDRDDLRIYIIPNPDEIESSFIEADIIDFDFPDQTTFPPPQSNRNFDIEALAWWNGYLYLFTKNRSNPQNGYCKLYRLPALAGTYTATLLDSIYLGNSNASARVTAADINHETGELVLLTAERIVSFTNYPHDRFFSGTMTDYYFSEKMGQIEALVFYTHRKLYMTEEGSSSNPGYLYDIDLDLIDDLPENSGTGYFRVSPNPSQGLFRIENTTTNKGILQLFTLEGQLVHTEAVAGSTVLNLNHLIPGKYIMLIESGNKHLHRRIIKL